MENKRYRIGVDLGGTTIKVGIVDANDRIVAKISDETRTERPWQDIAKNIVDLVFSLLKTLNIQLEDCEKMGIGSPGMIDHIKGVVVFSNNFGWDYVPLIQELNRFIDLPTKIANDADCATLGETVAGAGKGLKYVVMLTLGTGVGGGVVANSVLQQGSAAGGMELGHTLLMLDGEECTCGRRGCVEAYASATAIIKQARRAAKTDPSSLLYELCSNDLNNLNGAIIFKAAAKNDPTAERVVGDYIRYLGETIINFINIWRPEVVLLGGGISNAGDDLLIPLNKYVAPRCYAGERGFVPKIDVATLRNDAGIIGAASL